MTTTARATPRLGCDLSFDFDDGVVLNEFRSFGDAPWQLDRQAGRNGGVAYRRGHYR